MHASTYLHTCLHTYIDNANIVTCICIHTFIHLHVHTCLNAWTHTLIRAWICTYTYTFIYAHSCLCKIRKIDGELVPRMFFQFTSAHTICRWTMSDFCSMIKLNCKSPGNQPAWKKTNHKPGEPTFCPGNQPLVQGTNPSRLGVGRLGEQPPTPLPWENAPGAIPSSSGELQPPSPRWAFIAGVGVKIIFIHYSGCQIRIIRGRFTPRGFLLEKFFWRLNILMLFCFLVAFWCKLDLNLVYTHSEFGLNLVSTWSELGLNLVWTWSKRLSFVWTLSKLGLNLVQARCKLGPSLDQTWSDLGLALV